MTYNISVANHPTIVISDGTIDTSTSLTLVGKNYPNYGGYLAQDLVNLTQNWASVSQPANALTGQLWYDVGNSILKIYTGAAFKTITSVTSSSGYPQNAIQGDLWFNNSANQLYVYSGSTWLLVGPTYSAAQQQTTAIADTVIDNSNSSHTILKLMVGGTLVGIISKDAQFTPKTAISGFTTINPGYNVNAAIFTAAGILVGGTLTTNAQPYITSLGVLSQLTVSTDIIGNVVGYSNTVSNPAQPNITSVGSSLTVNGPITANTTVYAQAVSAPTIGTAGTVFTGANVNLTGAVTAPLFNGASIGTFDGVIGQNTPSAGTFTVVTVSGTVSGNRVSGNYVDGQIGNYTPASAKFTSVTTSGAISASGTISTPTLNAGTIGNSGAIFTGQQLSLTNTASAATVQANQINALNGGQLYGYHTGAIGANVPNIGVFTSLQATTASVGTLSVTNPLTLTNTITSQAGLLAPSLNAGTIGNTGANFVGLNATLTGNIAASGNIRVTSSSAKIGYSGQAFSSVFQSTSITSNVSINTPSGNIALYRPVNVAAGTQWNFYMNNPLVTPRDVVYVSLYNTYVNTYNVNRMMVGNGWVKFSITNDTSIAGTNFDNVSVNFTILSTN